MTLPAPPYFFAGERAQMAGDLLAAFKDDNIARAVTYRDFQGEAFDPATGKKVRSYLDLPCDPAADGGAIVSDLPGRQVANSAGLYQVGDVQFELPVDVLGAITPSRDDRMVDAAGTVFDVVDWHTDPMGFLWRIVARKVA